MTFFEACLLKLKSCCRLKRQKYYISECKKLLVEMRWTKEVGVKEEVDIKLFQDCDHLEEVNMFLPSQASALADNLAVWRKSLNKKLHKFMRTSLFITHLGSIQSIAEG